MSKVIEYIADIQIEALTSIVNNPGSVNHEDLRKYLQIEDEEITQAANKLIDVYINIKENPNCIKLLNEYQLMVCSHLLFEIEDEFIVEDLGLIEVNNAWGLIIEAQRKFHPELRIIIDNL